MKFGARNRKCLMIKFKTLNDAKTRQVRGDREDTLVCSQNLKLL